MRECRETCVDLIEHYGEVKKAISPLSNSVRTLAEEHNSYTENTLDQFYLLHQQYTSLVHDMGKLDDEVCINPFEPINKG